MKLVMTLFVSAVRVPPKAMKWSTHLLLLQWKCLPFVLAIKLPSIFCDDK